MARLLPLCDIQQQHTNVKQQICIADGGTLLSLQSCRSQRTWRLAAAYTLPYDILDMHVSTTHP
jgi:hypothetical protein